VSVIQRPPPRRTAVFDLPIMSRMLLENLWQ
jgi:hypothetical protein